MRRNPGEWKKLAEMLDSEGSDQQLEVQLQAGQWQWCHRGGQWGWCCSGSAVMPRMTGQRGVRAGWQVLQNWEMFDSPEGGAAIHRGLKRLEKWADRMPMSRGECQVLQLERNNARHEYRLWLSVWKAALWRRAQGSWWT